MSGAPSAGGLPTLTPEQQKQVHAHYMERPYSTLRLSAVALGFATLDQLRVTLSQEQAAASVSTLATAPALSALTTPAADALSATVAPARIAATPVLAPRTKQEIADFVRAHFPTPSAQGPRTLFQLTPAAALPASASATVAGLTRQQKAAADSAVALFSQAKSRTGSGDASSDSADSAVAVFDLLHP